MFLKRVDGPRQVTLPDGTRVLVFASDDNFNPAQSTQFIAAEYIPTPPER